MKRSGVIALVLLALASAGVGYYFVSRQTPQASNALEKPPSASVEEMAQSIATNDWEKAARLEEELIAAGAPAVASLAAAMKARGGSDEASMEFRQRAAWILGSIGTEEAFIALAGALGQEREKDVRGQIILGLSKIAGIKAIELLVGVMKNPAEEMELRCSAVSLLARRPEAAGTDAVMAMYKSSDELAVLQGCVLALGFSSQRAAAAPFLMEIVKSGCADSLRGQAVVAYSRLNKETAIPMLAGVLENERTAALRESAVDALGELVSHRPAQSLLTELLVIDSSERVRAQAASALGVERLTAALEPLLGALGQEKETFVQMKIVQSIAQINGSAAMDTLQKVIDGKYPEKIRGYAAVELKRIKSQTPRQKDF